MLFCSIAPHNLTTFRPFFPFAVEIYPCAALLNNYASIYISAFSSLIYRHFLTSWRRHLLLS